MNEENKHQDPNDPVIREEMRGNKAHLNNAHHISVTIDEKDFETAIRELKKAVEEIESGSGDCSAHDDTYMPYYWWTSYPYSHKT